MKRISRDTYDKVFQQVNASWGYENNAMTTEEKEEIYRQLQKRRPSHQSKMKRSRTMSSSEYLYPGTNVLINKFDARDQVSLDRQERLSTGYRALEIRFNPLKQTFDFDHLKKIHEHLFQDVYPFAGQIRTTNIGKNGFWFCNKDLIDRHATIITMELKAENNLKGLPIDTFADRAAYYYTEFNFIHPFREGNGRTIREFFSDLARNNNMELHWDRVPKEEYMHAVKLTDDPKMRGELVEVFKKCLSPIEEKSLVQWKELEEPMKLKDVLKIPEGLPKNAETFSAQILNLPVNRYALDPAGNKIKIQFEGEKNTRTIQLETNPYLSHLEKNALLDQAADLTAKAIQKSNFLEQ